MKRLLVRFWRDETGATAVEYGIVAALIAIAMISAAGTMGKNVSGSFKKVGSNIK